MSSHCYLHQELKDLVGLVEKLSKQVSDLSEDVAQLKADKQTSLEVKEVKPMRKKEQLTLFKPLSGEELKELQSKLEADLDDTQVKELNKTQRELDDYLDNFKNAVKPNNEKA